MNYRDGPTGERPENNQDAVTFSRQKLQTVADSLSPWIAKCRQLPCQSAQDAVGYRCRCAFQCVWTESGQKMHYAIRRNQEPVLTNTFPIANARIQKAMAALRVILNSKTDGSLSCLRYNLTSISFSSSWSDDLVDSDCVVTLHYDKAIQNVTAWKAGAKRVCQTLGLTQLTGRSRRRIARALDVDTEPIIRDTLWIVQNGTQPQDWKVSLDDPRQYEDLDGATTIQSVSYEKPEGAFFHPNSRAMCRALEWMLSRLSLLACSIPDRKVKLLELYCGCGAHTVALLKSGLLDSIVAIEYDERLVKACHRNCALNQVSADGESKDSSTVEIILADAAVWARDNASNNNFDILLVDPPRQGLDGQVCHMAVDGQFEHFLYISCGRDALVRDLHRLSNDFQVVDCTLLDLFPQTDAVESLVYLQRRKY